MVVPAGPIPAKSDDNLYLSNSDDMLGARVFTPKIYFYKSDYLNSCKKPVMETLTNALVSVLVPYYPLSRGLREKKNGKSEVFFGPQQGAFMVEAYSEMRLSDLGDLTVPNPAWSPLIYKFPDEEPYKILDMPLLIAQVMVFSYGGFSLGLRLCHCICDGLGAMQFLAAWALMAKLGTLVTNPVPCWDIKMLKPREPPTVKYPHIEFMKVEDGSNLTINLWQEKLVQKCYRIGQEFQAKLKSLAQTNEKFSFTTFDVMEAHVWQSWVKTLDVKPLDYKLRLTFQSMLVKNSRTLH